MKTTGHIILIFLILSACTQSESNPTKAEVSDQKADSAVVDSLTDDVAPWSDYFIQDYMDHNPTRFQDSKQSPITYQKELSNRKERGYVLATIGQHFEDRYVTYQRIFVDTLIKEILEHDLANDELKPWSKFQEIENDSNVIPQNGTYLFDVAFAEWEGRSMGVKMTVVIDGDSAKVIYEGRGALTAEIGELIDQGQIMKHKSGEWIIGTDPSDKDLDEVGGCTGGPAIIDFKNRKYWMC